ncbi:capsule assembly Wzi family protein [Proteobacteria bacterium 005FR1]|nr:capsule assembly Wzi family protein [Proteobacteria bacterium 005FR1]
MTSIHWTLVGGAVACLTTALTTTQSHAAPWFEPGDTYARFKLQQAADRGELQSTVTSWPLAHANAGQASAVIPQQSAEQGSRISASASGSSESRFIRGFEGGVRDEGQVGLSFTHTGESIAVNISPAYVIDPADDEQLRFDGSFVAATHYNWQAGAGFIDRWWGPGWQSSLILSSNARPVPSVWLNRQNTRAFESQWLNWIGPWQFTGFFGRLEEERYVPDANLIGMRLNFRPFNSGLEVGLSRLIQWGGEGRPTSSESLVDAILGRDNVGSEGIDEDPGNQLGAIDLRYGFALGEESMSLYAQVVGEDEAGNWLSKNIYQLGADWTSSLFSSEQQWFLEAVDTMTEGAFRGEPSPNVAYEHSQYRTGMRYLGRNLANTFDADARAISLGMHAFTTPHNRWSAVLTWADLNRDGQSRFQKSRLAAGNSNIDYAVPAGQQQVAVLDLVHSRPLPGGRGSIYLSLASDEIQLADETLSAANIGLEWQIDL